MKRMSGRIAAGANDLVNLWKAKSEVVGSGAFDADLDLQLATMDAIIDITMGSPLGCVGAAYNALPSSLFQSGGVVHLPHFEPPPLHKALKAIMESIEKASTAPFPLLSARLFTYTSPTWRKHYNLLSSFFSSAIAHAREREAILGNKGEGLAIDADCVLDMIIEREAREGTESLGKGELLDELLTYVFAGQDTTAASLAWLVKFLPKDAEIQRRLHDEVCAVFGPDMDSNEPLDFNLLDDHEHVPVLEAVVAETLRCAGVGSLTGRELIQDETISGRFVPKGTQLMFTTALMSSNKSEWGPDAQEWRPSRWLNSDGAFNRAAGPSIPFGLGQRSCFGQRLAVLQLKAFVATMSRTFYFKPVPSEVDVWGAVELVTRQPKACYASLERIATALPKSQLSLPANETWKKHRRLAGPSMSRRYLERMCGRIAFGANELVGLWRTKYALVGSAAFDAALDFHLATMDSIVGIAMGDSIGCIKSAYSSLPSSYSQSGNIAHLPYPEPPPLYTAGKVVAKEFERALQSPFPGLTTWLFTYTSPTWWGYYNLMTSFFTNAITRARKREAELGGSGQGLSTNADCVLDMIVQRETHEGVETLGDRDILDELATYVFAGQDTTASALSWLVKYLANDPKIQRRLHEEVCTVFGGDTASDEPLDFDLLDDPERVPVLEAVVAETMRCAAVVSFISRQLLKDETILGRFVPKGTQIFFATELMGKDESEWGPDAKEWRPSRWLTPDGAFNRLAGPSIPFGMGQRSCFGQRLAILQLKAYVAAMSRAFFFKPVPSEVDTWEAVELITRRPVSCYVSLERWDSKDYS
ncbi:hypothetical protein FRC11_008830 [Ceratobasidium sp. 423]|nr:hypothetical protein FRC11_008830 [Ceratobasidium sp. 423]